VTTTKEIKKGVGVHTKDGTRLGRTVRMYHRLEGVDPDVKLYENYVLVRDWDLGDEYFIPTRFIDTIDEESGEIHLAVKLSTVNQEQWTRAPQFIYTDEGQEIELE
jgi:hypothetical protein